MSENIKIFLKFNCDNVRCGDCVLSEDPICKPMLTVDDVEFLKQEYPEYFI